MKTNKGYLSALVSLGLGFAVTATAGSRTWTDVSGKHTVEAEFVSLEGGKITLKTTTGKVTTFPLENLSPADREFAKSLAGGGVPMPIEGDVEVTAKASLSQFVGVDGDGNQTSSNQLKVKVDLTGGAAAAAYAVGPFVAEPAVIGGKAFEPSEGFWADRFEMIDRSKTGFFAKHPEGGIRVEIDYEGDVPEGAATVESVKGSVKVLAGGTAKVVALDKLLERPAGPIKDRTLAAVGLDLTFKRKEFGENIRIEVGMKVGARGFAGLELVGADGKPLKGTGSGSSSFGDTVDHSISGSEELFAGATLRIHVREGAKEIDLPFEVKGLAIGG